MASGDDWLTAGRLTASYTTWNGVGEETPIRTTVGPVV